MCFQDGTGTAHMQDCYSTAATTPKPDASLTGTSDLRQYTGQEVNGETTLKFLRYLVTGDTTTDRTIAEGDNSVILAFHPSSDDVTMNHGENSATLVVNFLTGT